MLLLIEGIVFSTSLLMFVAAPVLSVPKAEGAAPTTSTSPTSTVLSLKVAFRINDSPRSSVISLYLPVEYPTKEMSTV